MLQVYSFPTATPFQRGLILALLLALLLNPGVVSLRVTGIDHIEGFLRIAVFQGEEHFPEGIENAFLKVTVPASSETVTVPLPPLEFGEYAIALFHDRDGDAVVDRNFLGIPTEEIGFSSGARAITGPPDYEDAVFQLGTETLLMFIELH